MPAENIPEEIVQFIAAYLRSVEQLEILLLVHGRAGAQWSVQSVYDVIVSSKPSIERWLEEFVRLRFFQKTADIPATYFFGGTEEISRQVAQLAEIYKTKPVRVIEAIFKRDRDPVQSFADAFKIKKQP
jgi:hypothetical protein